MPTDDKTDETKRATALREAYTASQTRLREAHLEEFNRYRAEEAEKRGIEWKPPVSAKDKAREALKSIFSEHPDLLAQVRGEVDGSPGTP